MLALVLSLTLGTVTSNCTLSASEKGGPVLVSCRSEDELALSLVTADGRSTPVRDADSLLADAVPTGPPQWSPSGRFVAFEVGLAEEPGVLLIELNDKPAAVFVDRPLVPLGVSAAGPQWHPSGQWLLFHTSGTGDLAREGVYALRLADRVIVRLLTAHVRSMAISGNTLYAVHVKVEGDGNAELASFKLDELLAKAVRVAPPEEAPRERQEKH